MAVKPNWYVSCSPRSPEKIIPEIKILYKYNNTQWKGNNSKAQNSFSNDLVLLPDFKGKTHKKEKSFSARDRVAPMKTYGFVYVNELGNLIFTQSGIMLKDGRRPKDVFLKQLIKWQYPSNQHKGNSYDDSKWEINPFVFTLRVIEKLDGITKMELAIFLLVATKETEIKDVVNRIKKFRHIKRNISSKNRKNDFEYKYFFYVYSKKFHAANKIREGKSGNTNKEKIETKIRNAMDVADSATRYFRYTGILSSRRNKLVFNQQRISDIVEILKNNYFCLNYEDKEKFYKYYGNSKFPVFSYENPQALMKEISNYDTENTNLIKSINKEFPNTKTELKRIIFLKSKMKNAYADVETLKDILYEEREIKIELKKKHLQIEFKNFAKIEEHIKLLELYYNKRKEIEETIAKNFIANKNTVLEHLLLNSFIILGGAENYINNFTIDENLNPISHAAGNQSDIEVEYSDFIILGEATTSKGTTQYKMEGEPVTRHYLNKKNETKKALYCVFVAPEINSNTFEEFKTFNTYFGTKIISLTIKQLITILKAKKNNSNFSAKTLRQLLDELYIITISANENTLEIKHSTEKAISSWIDN